jgi:hypothetical protein
VLYSDLLGYIGDVFALVEVEGGVGMLPVVGNKEDCVRALKN